MQATFHPVLIVSLGRQVKVAYPHLPNRRQRPSGGVLFFKAERKMKEKAKGSFPLGVGEWGGGGGTATIMSIEKEINSGRNATIV